jgi:hypothetical protein
MHPYYYDVPLDWLEKAPVTNQAWRDGVIEYHNNKKALKEATKQIASKILINTNYKVGGNWRAGGKAVKEIFVTSVKPYRGIFDGWNVKINKRMLADMTPA